MRNNYLYLYKDCFCICFKQSVINCLKVATSTIHGALKHKCYIVLFSLFFNLFPFFIVDAQDYEYEKFTTDNGLIQNQITCLIQDQQGYIWIGTKGGISRYDGYEFKNYTQKDGLSDTYTKSLFLDAKGEVWAITSDGLYKFHKDTFISYPFKKGFMLIDALFSPKQGLYAVGEKNDKYQLFKFKNGHFVEISKLQPKKLSIYLNQDSSLTIRYFKNDTSYYYQNNKFTKRNRYTNLLPYKQHQNLWVKGDSIFIITKDSASFFRKKIKQRKLFYNRVDYYNDKVFFITYEGICEYNLQDTSTGFYPVDYYATCFLVDNQNNYWIGTEMGIYMLKTKAFKFFTSKHGINETVWTMVKDENNDFWFISYKGPLKKYNSYKNESVVYPDLVEDNQYYYGSKIDFNGNLLFPFRYGVLCYDYKKFTKEYLDNKIVFSIFKDTINKKLLYCAQDYLFIKNKGNIEKYPTKPGNNLAATLGKDGNYWISRNSGIARFVNDTFQYFNKKYTQGFMVSIFQDTYHNIWYGGSSGFFYYDQNDFHKIHHPFFSDRIVTTITQVADSLLLIGTTRGMALINLKQFYENKYLQLKVYDNKNGFATQECQQNSFFHDKEGYVWIPLTDKIARINPRYLSFNTIFPKIHIKKVSQHNKNLNWIPVDKNKFSYNQNSIRFDFIAISHKAPEGIRYKYKLEGYEKQWSPVINERFAQYTNLPPGNYTFKVKAANNDGYWSTFPTTYSFTIMPAFWQRGIFQFALALFFIALIFFGAKIYSRNIKAKQQKTTKLKLEAQEEIKREISHELHDNIGSTVSALRVSLENVADNEKRIDNQIKMLDEVYSNIREISKLLKMPDFVDAGFLYAVENFIKKYNSKFQHIEFIAHPSQGWEDINIKIQQTLFRCIQELITNTLKHANAREVEIQLNRYGEEILLIYSDDGQGFDPKLQAQGIGLKNIRERVESIAGNCSIDSHPDYGITVEISIPLTPKRKLYV